MDENKKNIPAEEEPTILTLHDDEGNEEEFEFLDVIEYQEAQYIVLFPLEEDDMEIVILQVVQGRIRVRGLRRRNPAKPVTRKREQKIFCSLFVSILPQNGENFKSCFFSALVVRRITR